jgi:hypothetical protein
LDSLNLRFRKQKEAGDEHCQWGGVQAVPVVNGASRVSLKNPTFEFLWSLHFIYIKVRSLAKIIILKSCAFGYLYFVMLLWIEVGYLVVLKFCYWWCVRLGLYSSRVESSIEWSSLAHLILFRTRVELELIIERNIMFKLDSFN